MSQNFHFVFNVRFSSIKKMFPKYMVILMKAAGSLPLCLCNSMQELSARLGSYFIPARIKAALRTLWMKLD